MKARGRRSREVHEAPPDARTPPIPLKPEPIVAALFEHEVDFLVLGGFAVGVHGHVRGTKDIDICPDPDPENLRRLAAALKELRAEPFGLEEFAGEFELKPDFEGLSLGGNWVLLTRFGRLDVMQHAGGAENGWIDLEPHSVTRRFLGHQVRFCGYEGLIKMKKAAGRDQDLIDVRNLEAARSEL